MKILLTSCGGYSGVYLIKHLTSLGYTVYGADVSKNVALVDRLQALYTVPPCSDPKYIDNIRKIVVSEGIDAVLPVSSYDMLTFSEHTHDTVLKNRMLISDADTVRLLHNKKSCYHALNELGICTPKIYMGTEPDYPSLIKPAESSGSKNIHVLSDTRDWAYWVAKLPSGLVMEYLPGDEWTVDCLFNHSGICLGANIRKRMKVSNGSVTVSQNDNTYIQQVQKIVAQLNAFGRIRGAVNFQFKIVKGEACVFDFNTRFASGGLPLTVASGFDIPHLLIRLIQGFQIASWTCPKDAKEKTMIRYYEETFLP